MTFRPSSRENVPGFTAGKDGDRGVRAVERAADILTCLGEEERNLSDLSRAVGLSKPTVLRMLMSLERKGFVLRDMGTGKYSLDANLLGLLSNVLSQNREMISIAYPYMEKLWKSTEETITLYVRKGFYRCCIAELPSPQPLRYTVGIGVTVPLHAGSPGKLLLAFMATEEMNEVLDGIDMIRLTNRTITSRDELSKELLLIRERGWATSFGERIEGVSSLSVPITNRENKVFASINILGPYVRLGEKRLMGYLDMLKEVSSSISNRLVQ